MGTRARIAWSMLGLALAATTPPRLDARAAESEAEEVGPYPGTLSWQTEFGFREAVSRLRRAIASNGLTLVGMTETNAREHGVPASTVLLVSQDDFAAKIVRADSLAGMEMPIKIYVTEDADRHATVIYRTPSSLLALYDNKELDDIATQLDEILAKVIDDSIGG